MRVILAALLLACAPVDEPEECYFLDEPVLHCVEGSECVVLLPCLECGGFQEGDECWVRGELKRCLRMACWDWEK